MTDSLNGLKQFRIGAYGVLRREHEVLMVRTDTGKGTEILNFPGGAVDLGESVEVGLIRELKEEISCEEVEIKRLLHVSRGFFQSELYPEDQCVQIYYEIDCGSFEPEDRSNGDDIVGVSWQSLNALPRDEMWGPDLEFANVLEDLR